MNLAHDFRFAWRTLRKSPGFLVVATLSLGLGIALNTTIFSLVHSALFRVPEVERPKDLVNIYSLESGTADLNPQSVLDYLDLAASTTPFDGVLGHSLAIMNVQIGDRPTPLLGGLVTYNYFELLGVKPQAGRTFAEGEAVGEGSAPVAVLTDSYWRRAFAGDPKALRDSIRIGGVDFEIIGILPPGFKGLTRALQPEVFVPLAQAEHVEPMGEIVTQGHPSGKGILDWRGHRFLTVVGRLREGISLHAAAAEVNALAANLAVEYPDSNENREARLVPTSQIRIDPDLDTFVVAAAMIMLALVGMVLIVACANIGNMLLAKAEGRRQEIALRLSLGAGRLQLVRLMLVESTLLALLGGMAGLALAAVSTRLLTQVRFDLPIDLVLDPHLDSPVLFFTLAVSLATGLAFGLIPALQASARNMVPALKAEPRGVGTRGIKAWLQPARVLVVSQVALSLILLVVAGLLQRSVQQAQSVDLGFDADRLGVLTLDLSSLELEGEALESKWQQLASTVESVPGIEQAGIATRLPLGLNIHTSDFFIAGYRESETDPPLLLDVTQVTNTYFDTLGIRLEEGSWFPPPGTDSDPTNQAPTGHLAIVNQTMAQRFWPNQSALGKTFRHGTADAAETTIIGVVANYKVRTPGEEPRAMIHFPRSRKGSTFSNIIYRSTAPVATSIAPVTEALIRANPDILLMEATSLKRRRDFVLLPIRLGGILVSGLSALALLLAVVGLAGLVAYWVSQRTREIGIRTALGANQSHIARMVMGRTLSLVAVGTALGIAGSMVMGRLLATILYVAPADPISLTLGIAVLFIAAAIATLVPVRRATRVDTLEALHAE